MKKNEIENLTNEMLDGLKQALVASQTLAFEGGVLPALNAHLMVMTLLEALSEGTDEELMEKVMEFVDQRISDLGKTESKANDAINDLLKGIGGISLN